MIYQGDKGAALKLCYSSVVPNNACNVASEYNKKYLFVARNPENFPASPLSPSSAPSPRHSAATKTPLAKQAARHSWVCEAAGNLWEALPVRLKH